MNDRISESIEAVLTRFRAMVLSVGTRHGLVEADLDEVLQDVRIRLWKTSQGGRQLEELGSSYLYTVATTAALDLLRRRRARAASRTDDVTEQRDLPTPAPTPHERAELGELKGTVTRALETLSADRRTAVGLHLSGWAREDIARTLGWTEARTRNLVYRGLDDLRTRLLELGIAPGGVS